MRVKPCFIFLMIVAASFSYAQKSPEMHIRKTELEKIDSAFSCNYNVLRNYKNGTDPDQSGRRTVAIHFMEVTTGIASSGDMTYFGKLTYTKENVDAWYEWYLKNKNQLVWDEERKMIRKKKE